MLWVHSYNNLLYILNLHTNFHITINILCGHACEHHFNIDLCDMTHVFPQWSEVFSSTKSYFMQYLYNYYLAAALKEIFDLDKLEILLFCGHINLK
jgi:hypothetical protein